ncbi:hypothetical protein Bca52824_016948 [Brassica carinata]|uniref:WRKY domain-containing protein n=1 Tax=Brassica carinata TaxID=52824 RepID=A0A8X7VM62_BRACI|nr:hypothetical protein Bca52824_016948 [Brassica carinata]
MGIDQALIDHNMVDVLDVEPSSRKRRENEVSNMIGTTRTRENDPIIIQMESKENNPDDGFSWKKYGQKLIRGNPNPRNYYKCTFIGCNVKKHVERGADNVKSLVIAYFGNHEHDAPVINNWSGSSMSQDPGNPSVRKATFIPLVSL